MIYLIISILLFIGFLLFCHFYKIIKNNKLEENQIQYDEFTQQDTIYNESPINWELQEYKKETLDFHFLGDNKKNIIIIEQSLPYQKIFFDLLKDEYNLYFFEDGLFFAEYYKKNLTLDIDLFIISEHCQIINGIVLYQIHKKHDVFNKIPHIMTSVNKNHYTEEKYSILIKPFTNEYALKIIKKAM